MANKNRANQAVSIQTKMPCMRYAGFIEAIILIPKNLLIMYPITCAMTKQTLYGIPQKVHSAYIPTVKGFLKPYIPVYTTKAANDTTNNNNAGEPLSLRLMKTFSLMVKNLMNVLMASDQTTDE